MPSKERWILIVGLLYFFSYGLEFLTGLFGRPTNLISAIVGAETTGFIMFLAIWIIMWASGSLSYLRRKAKL